MVRVAVLVPVDGKRDTAEQRHALSTWRKILPGADIIRGTNTETPYNRAVALNMAASLASDYDIFVITDRDLIYPEARTAVDIVSRSGKWVMTDRIVRLSPSATRLVLRGRSLDRTMQRAPGNERYRSKGGCVVLPHSLWDEAGGMDRRFQGWGNEDTAFMSVLRTFRGNPVRTGTQWHLWHPATYRPGTRTKLWDGQTEAHISTREHLTSEYKAAEGYPDKMRCLLDGRYESEPLSPRRGSPPLPHPGPPEA